VSRGHDHGTHLKQYHSSKTAWESSETAPLKQHQIDNNKCTIKPTATASAHLSGSVAAPVVPLQVQHSRDKTHKFQSVPSFTAVNDTSMSCHVVSTVSTSMLTNIRHHCACTPSVDAPTSVCRLSARNCIHNALELAWHVSSQAMLPMWLGCGPHQITITEDQWRG
jgi:hypothetical protein